ncbi:tRNA (guanosine(37)-N1)-methyltransferase TrmD [Candidatus Kuenenbacteria bacterium RIFCSPLOWO2_02_FULL_42_16]|uniref:tRNA (guanine-N(1)-)-methyltransferase n=2 Tax=Candidatus Kueneniibacteriota TaxID=1752740 RepID=A0A1F6G0W8_9BACT|nr:MAG: tRNA (guanosine(37)-N1)-methyltransferase TrmD [Candidatus Kuenenbacteria bacterium RIFCSPLOWO2_02_FULL_42_16]
MEFDLITIFPHVLDSYLNESILKRAQKKKLIKIKFHDPRAFAVGRHKTVDDRPFGGGPGMLMKIEPLYKTLKKIKRQKKARVILFDPAGIQFSQAKAKEFSRLNQLVMIAGRYEGVDNRIEKFIDEKISIGSYVLSGGELPAAVVIEAVSRLLPGVLGNRESLKEETYSEELKIINLKLKINQKEYPHYTRPEVFSYIEKGKKKKLVVPKVLLSGDHQAIKKWRGEHRR